jgi:DNA-binding NtrC family response regulator
MTRLQELPWPGNVAQLKAAIEHADLVCDGQVIEVDDLPRALAFAHVAASYAGSEMPTGVLPPSEAEAGRSGLDFKGRVREYEIRMIVDALRRSGGNQRATARLLRIPLRTLAHKIKAFRIKHRLALEVARERGVSG